MIFVVGVCRVVANLTQSRFATVDVREKRKKRDINVVVVIETDVSIFCYFKIVYIIR